MPDFEHFNTTCPTTGESCPNRELLVELYTDNHDNPHVDADTIELDNRKLNIKLHEQALWAKAGGGCTGPENETCPTRDHMNESKIRKGLVATVRSLTRRS